MENRIIDHYTIFENELRKRKSLHEQHKPYKILQKISIPEAIEKLKKYEIKSKRFYNVMQLGDHCVVCGKKTSYVALGEDNGKHLHWDLYAEDGTLMSIDHIIPKSKGGKDHFSNYQLHCSPCNHSKGNFIDAETTEKLVEEILKTGYQASEESEKLIKTHIKEIFYRQNSFTSTVNVLSNFNEDFEQLYLHLNKETAKSLRRLEPATVNLFHEFGKRLKEMQNDPMLFHFIDYEIGKVYIIKPKSYNFFDKTIRNADLINNS